MFILYTLIWTHIASYNNTTSKPPQQFRYLVSKKTCEHPEQIKHTSKYTPQVLLLTSTTTTLLKTRPQLLTRETAAEAPSAPLQPVGRAVAATAAAATPPLPSESVPAELAEKERVVKAAVMEVLEDRLLHAWRAPPWTPGGRLGWVTIPRQHCLRASLSPGSPTCRNRCLWGSTTCSCLRSSLNRVRWAGRPTIPELAHRPKIYAYFAAL